MASEKITSALRILWKYQEFFMAPFIYQEEFQEWALSHQELVKPLSDALSLALGMPVSTTNNPKSLLIPKIDLNQKDIIFQDNLKNFQQALLGKSSTDDTSLYKGGIESMLNFLNQHPDLVYAISRYEDERLFESWYNDHPWEKHKYQKRLLKEKMKEQVVNLTKTISPGHLTYRLEADVLRLSDNPFIQEYFEQESTQINTSIKEGSEQLLRDGLRNLSFNGCSFADNLSPGEIKLYTSGNEDSIKNIEQKFDNFLNNKLILNKNVKILQQYYQQDLLSLANHLLTAVLLPYQGVLQAHYNSTINYEEGEIYIITTASDIKYFQGNAEDSLENNYISIPGTLVIKQKLTEQGMQLANISVSNHWLYQCVMNNTIAPTASALMLAQAEETFNTSLQKIYGHSQELKQKGNHAEALQAIALTQSLRQKTQYYLLDEWKTPTKTRMFIGSTKKDIYQADQVLRQHRSWKGIMTNMLLALTGIGSAIMACKELFSQKHDFRLFRTTSAKQLDKVEDNLLEITNRTQTCQA